MAQQLSRDPGPQQLDTLLIMPKIINSRLAKRSTDNDTNTRMMTKFLYRSIQTLALPSSDPSGKISLPSPGKHGQTSEALGSSSRLGQS